MNSPAPIQPLLDQLLRRVNAERFLHILGVTHTATTLAAIHGEDVTLAALAALLHDVSKEIPPLKIEADLADRGIAIPPEDRPYPAIWHGLHAAVLAREARIIPDDGDLDRVARAVELHSTGDRGIDRLAKILFLADSLEPGRDWSGVNEIRELARRDLDAAFELAVDRKISKLEAKDRVASPRAKRALAESRERKQRA